MSREALERGRASVGDEVVFALQRGQAAAPLRLTAAEGYAQLGRFKAAQDAGLIECPEAAKAKEREAKAQLKV